MRFREGCASLAAGAVASSVFVTMITDSMGFFAFLGLAVASGAVG